MEQTGVTGAAAAGVSAGEALERVRMVHEAPTVALEQRNDLN